MSDFDRFIKNLGESESPEFKEEYWKQFSRKAGFQSGITKIVISSAVSAVIVGGGIWAGLHFADQPENAPEIAPTTELTIPDTTVKVSEEIFPPQDSVMKEENQAELEEIKPVSKPSSSRENPPPKESIECVEKELQTEPAIQPPVEKPKRDRRSGWESYMFDPDTIEHNR